MAPPPLAAWAAAAPTAIADRDAKARAAARDALVAAYPKPAAAEADRRGCESLAKRVHAALGKARGEKDPFPDRDDRAARERLLRAW